MKLFVEPTYDRKGNLQNAASLFKPSDEEKEFLKMLTQHMQTGDTNMRESYEEFNFRSVIEYMNDNQRAFNSFKPEPSADPDFAWRANTVRPMTRNRCIAIAAHMTATVLYPNVVAQNSENEEDQDASMVLRDILDYALQKAKYERKFVSAIITALFNPAVIIKADYAEVMRKVKEMQDDGRYTVKEVVDEFFSGFLMSIVNPDELYIANPYEPEIQKQNFLIERQFISFEEAQIIFADSENVDKITPGVKYFYSSNDDLFYEQADDRLKSKDLVELVTYYNRFQDMQVRVVNGIPMDPIDNPLQRQDKRYPFVKGYYEMISERFFYGKSLTDKIAPDQDIIDVAWNMMLDASFLQTMPPNVIFGGEELDSSVAVPGKTTYQPLGAQMQTLNTAANMNPALNAVQQLERSASESSADPLQMGGAPSGSPTAFQIATMQQNAMQVMGLFGKMLKYMVEDFGELMLGLALTRVTIADITDLLSDSSKVRFASIVVPDRKIDGKKVSRRIEFTTEMPESPEQAMEESFKLLKLEREKGMSIAKANPQALKKMNTTVKVEADLLLGQSENVRKAMNLEAYDRLVQNPAVDIESVTRDFLLGTYRPGEEDKYIKKQEFIQQAPEAAGGSRMTEMIMRQAGARAPMA